MNLYTKISIRVIIMFLLIIISSFIPDNMHKLFGDVHCNGCTTFSGMCNAGTKDMHVATWHYGFRHFMWILMGLGLFIVQAAHIFKLIDESYGA